MKFETVYRFKNGFVLLINYELSIVAHLGICNYEL